MEVILLKDVDKLGYVNDVVNVKNGFGRNYLIPQKKAVIANPVNRKKLEERLEKDRLRRQQMLGVFQEMEAKLKDAVIKIAAKTGTTDKIFGSVTNVQLSAAIKEQLDIDIERRDIKLNEDVKTLGAYTAVANLHPEVQAAINFEVYDDDKKGAGPKAKVEKAVEEAPKVEEVAEAKAEEVVEEVTEAVETAADEATTTGDA